MKKLWFGLVLALTLLGVNPSAWSAVYYVTPTSDSDCSDFNCDFQNALNAASANDEGDTIYLSAGTYDASAVQFVWNTTKNYPLTIIGSDGAVLDGGNTSRCMFIDTSNQPNDGNSHVTIHNITFQNGSQPLNNGGAVYAWTSGANVTLQNCSFINCTSQYGGGAQIYSSGSVIIRNNVFIGNAATDNDGGGIGVMGPPTSVIVEGNLFYENSAKVYGGAISISAFGTVDFLNNVVYTNTATFGSVHIVTADVASITNNTLAYNAGNGGGCLWVDLITVTTTANIYNNIIWNESASIYGDIRVNDRAVGGNNGAVVNLYNNNFTDFFSECSNILGCTPHINQYNNKNVNPQFLNVSDLDPVNWDLRLSFGSEAIDTGDNTVCALTDIRGVTRPQDGNKDGANICDMGAYEILPVDLSTFEGTIGTEITIMGSGFGDKKGKVFIGNAATKIITWSDSEIACTVKKVPLPAALNNVMIKQSPKTGPAVTLTSIFTVMNPIITAVEPNHGSPEQTITIRGRFFGSKKGKIYIGDNRCKVVTSKWIMNGETGESEIQCVVPKKISSGSYDVKVINKVGTATLPGGFTVP